MAIQLDQYYRKAKVYWGNKKSSMGVPYMVHIDQGLLILNHSFSTTAAKAAFCIHGLMQSDADLLNFYYKGRTVDLDNKVLFLALEYRNTANQWLREHGADAKRPDIVLTEIRDMLVADKVQNYHNFLTNYKDIHKDSVELEAYFTNWLEHLNVKYEDYAKVLK